MTALPVGVLPRQEDRYKPRHAAPNPVKTSRIRKAVHFVRRTIRIPGPVNRALDASGTRPAVTATVVVLAAVTAAAWVWGSGWQPRAATGVLAVYAGVAWHVVKVRALREQARQDAYDLAALQAENTQLRAGDPTAPTAQLRTIGEAGELR